MPELTIYDIEWIAGDVRSQEIIFPHLADELIDHICCDVEQEMDNGLTFSEAYARVRQKIGKRRLKEIQEETLYATDSKYRIMKTTMKFSAVAGTVLFGVAAMFKIQHWPGAGIMLTLGALILTFLFMPSALVVLRKETRSRKRLVLFISAFLSAGLFITGILFKIQHWNGAGPVLILAGIIVVFLLIPSLLSAALQNPENTAFRPVYITGAIGLAAFFTGFLFKIMHWQGAGILLLSGLSVISIIVLPWYTWLKWKDEKHVRPGFIFLIAGLLSVIMPAALLNLNLQRSFDEGYFTNLEEQQALFSCMFHTRGELLASYRDSSTYELMKEIDSRTGDLLGLINSVEKKMVGESEGEPGNPVGNPSQIIQTEAGPEIKFRQLSFPFHTSPVHDFLAEGAESRDALDKAISEYRTWLSATVPADIRGDVDRMPDISKYITVPAGGDNRRSMLSGLHSLAVMKNSLLAVEQHALREIAEN
ncbi:MAG: hypothetical protein RBS38_05420 [Bacteroidales bacterium]|jgi:hypothetical protein|nr:hypothetical protein [Bacteroidales bacterium]